MRVEIAKYKHEPGVWGIVTSRHQGLSSKFLFVLVERQRSDGSLTLGEEIQEEADVEIVSHEVVGV